jgi:hypothetical protein
MEVLVSVGRKVVQLASEVVKILKQVDQKVEFVLHRVVPSISLPPLKEKLDVALSFAQSAGWNWLQ